MSFVKVKNGNYTMFIDLETGTKIRKNNLDCFIPEKPESMDIKITNNCDIGCAFCLKPYTKLNRGDTTIAIADVKVGDSVASFNIETQATEFKEIKKLYERHYFGKLIKIQDEFGHVVTCTPNHKVYTANRGYVRADELTIDDLLIVE